jgi:hypothetical protein
MGGQSTECNAPLNTFLAAVSAMFMVVLVQAFACLAAAGVTWVPLFGIAPAAYIAATLFLQVLLMPTLWYLYDKLRKCLGPIR